MDDIEASIRSRLRHAFDEKHDPLETRTKRFLSVSLAGYEATGVTQHFRNGVLLDKPASLSISQIGDDPGFYLLYLNDVGEELADTYHDTIERALEQAEAEFNVRPQSWSREGD